MKKIISLMLCVVLAFAFVSCKKESAKNKTNSTASFQTATTENAVTTDDNSESEKTDSETTSKTTGKTTKKTTEKTTKKAKTTKKENTTKKETTESTTTPMPKTKAKEAVSISRDDALKRLKDFYGSAYHVEETQLKKNIQHYEVRDNMGNLYAKLEVNLKTSDAKETVVHSGEVNTFNLLV